MQRRPGSPEPSTRPRVVVVGASGSIGHWVCEDLVDDCEVTALTRFDPPPESSARGHRVRWRRCDMFARSELDAALDGNEYAIFLVHTRLPSARLDQAQCEDMDLIIADNVARAASRNGIRQIICLQGLLPRSEDFPELVRHLNEPVHVLGSYGTPVTVLRAGLVVAPGSSSVNLLAGLVSRSRIVPLPEWARAKMQPISLPDLLRAIRHCIGNPEMMNAQFDIGGPEIFDFREILELTASLLGRRPRLVALAWFPPWLFDLWVRRKSPRTHPALVRLLMKDLRHDGLARDNPLQAYVAQGALLCREAIEPYLKGKARARLSNPRTAIRPIFEAQFRESSTVRSIQRMRLPPGRNAQWLATHYFKWLPKFVWPFVQCEVDQQGTWVISVRWVRIPLLSLSFQPERSTPDRRMYFITGGMLADRARNHAGRMEFHDVLDGRYCIVAIHDFAPALPWNFYHWTQARAHGFVMAAFQRRMRRLAKRKAR